jgi:hypothetical protein
MLSDAAGATECTWSAWELYLPPRHVARGDRVPLPVESDASMVAAGIRRVRSSHPVSVDRHVGG